MRLQEDGDMVKPAEEDENLKLEKKEERGERGEGYEARERGRGYRRT